MINFYYMENCPYCTKAKETLKDEIASGLVSIKSAKEANGASGFPYFVETTTGATHTGFMADKQKLFEKLGVKQNKETYHNAQAHHNAQAPSKEQFENCSSIRGGYLTLSKTWSRQKSYVS